jgi:hypothetical protein
MPLLFVLSLLRIPHRYHLDTLEVLRKLELLGQGIVKLVTQKILSLQLFIRAFRRQKFFIVEIVQDFIHRQK